MTTMTRWTTNKMMWSAPPHHPQSRLPSKLSVLLR
jgi:hypothetical protein